MNEKPEAIVHITIKVPMEYFTDFLVAWGEEYRERLIEHGGIDEAYAEIPETVKNRMELSK